MAYLTAVRLGLLMAAVAAESQECNSTASIETCDGGMADDMADEEASLLAHRMVTKQRALAAGGHSARKSSSRRLEEGSGCSGSGQDCRQTKCCQVQGQRCFEKDQYWAGCMSSCQPRIHYEEPRPYQTPWSCRVLNACSAAGEDCRSSKCCEDATATCYEKDPYWAGCLSSCQPGIHYDEGPQYQTPWSCKQLGLEACLRAAGGSLWTYVGNQVREDNHKDIHNARVTGNITPSAVVFATKESEVVHAVSCAYKFQKPVYGRSGMNQYEASCADEQGGGAGCVLVDTSNMWQVGWATGCDAGKDGCIVTLGPGLSLGSAYVQLSEKNYTLPAGTCAQVRVAGLTLGGGKGWLTRKYGLSLDRLRGIDAVLLDGRKVHASANEEPNLFWLARGGGGNIFPGVVTAFHFAVVPMPQKPLTASRTWDWSSTTASCRQQLFKNWYDMLAIDRDEDLFARLTIQNFGTAQIIINMYYYGSHKHRALNKLRSVGGQCGHATEIHTIESDTWLGIVRAGNNGASNTELRSNNCGWNLSMDGETKKAKRSLCYGFTTDYTTSWAYRSLVFGKGKKVPESVWKALADVSPTRNFFIEIDPSNGAAANVSSKATAYPWRDPGYVTLQQNMRGNNTEVQAQMVNSTLFMKQITAQVPKKGYYNYLDKSMQESYGGDPRSAYYGTNADTVEKYLKQYTEGVSPNGCDRCESWELRREQ